MHELKCINYSSTDSEQLFSTDTQVLEGLPSSLLVLLDSVGGGCGDHVSPRSLRSCSRWRSRCPMGTRTAASPRSTRRPTRRTGGSPGPSFRGRGFPRRKWGGRHRPGVPQRSDGRDLPLHRADVM